MFVKIKIQIIYIIYREFYQPKYGNIGTSFQFLIRLHTLIFNLHIILILIIF